MSRILTDFQKGDRLVCHSVAHGTRMVTVYAGNTTRGWPVSLVADGERDSGTYDGLSTVYESEAEAKANHADVRKGYYFVVPDSDAPSGEIAESESGMVNECPFCEGELTAECSVVIEYAIRPERDGGQDWSRHIDSDAIDDDSMSCQEIKCDSCGREWGRGEFKLDKEGYLVELIGDPQEDSDE